jgi:prepilin-type N-terminal cleavage/methylation domain-containing protein
MFERRDQVATVSHSRSDAAFTLIELLAVIVVLAVISGIAMPIFTDQGNRASLTTMTYNFNVLRQAATTYYRDNSAWPPDNDGSPGMTNYAASYWPNDIWEHPSPIGGKWNWNMGMGSAPSGCADADVCIYSIGSSPSSTVTTRMTQLDQAMDDGNLATGRMQFVAGSWGGTLRSWLPVP